MRDKYQRFLNDVALQDVRSDLHVDGSSAKIQDASGRKISINNIGDVGDLQTLLEQFLTWWRCKQLLQTVQRHQRSPIVSIQIDGRWYRGGLEVYVRQ